MPACFVNRAQAMTTPTEAQSSTATTLYFACFVIFAMSLGALLYGCAGDPNKEARTAQEAQAEAVRENQKRRAELEQRYAKELADMQSEQRKSFDLKMKQRIDKIDARAGELQSRMETARPQVRTALKDEWRAYSDTRNKVDSKVSEVKSSGDDNWKSASYELEEQLDDLEDALDRVAKKL